VTSDGGGRSERADGLYWERLKLASAWKAIATLLKAAFPIRYRREVGACRHGSPCRRTLQARAQWMPPSWRQARRTGPGRFSLSER